MTASTASTSSSPQPRFQDLGAGVTLYLVRHGETDWNRERRYQGQRDIPLNAHGHRQATRNGEALAREIRDPSSIRFIASPLTRAIETMRRLRCALGLSEDGFEIDARLKELHYGHWEGVLQQDLATSDPEGVAAKARDPFSWQPRGGESYADLQQRIAGWLSTLTGPTVAVTHGGVSRVARGAVLRLPPQSVPYLACPQDLVLVLEGRSLRWL